MSHVRTITKASLKEVSLMPDGSYEVGIDWGKTITDEANACGCNEPWLHSQDTLHKAAFDLRRAAKDLFDATLRTPCEWLLDRCEAFIRRLFS